MKIILAIAIFCSLGFALPTSDEIPAYEVEPGHAPFVVSLQYKFIQYFSVCAGVVLSENLILTSARCASTIWHVSVGVTSLPDDKGDAQQNSVQVALRHPKYNKSTSENDIAVLKLKTPLQLGPKAQAVTLPKQGEAPSRDPADLYGYNLRYISYGPLLVSKNQTLISREECARQVDHHFTLETSICTSPVGTGDGDLGGPLIQNGVLIGIISRNTRHRREADTVALFTATNMYIDWINNVTKSLL